MSTEDDPLIDAQRAAIAEEIACALAHDIRNKIGTIRNAAFFLQRRARSTSFWGTDDRIAQMFELIDGAVTSSDAVLDERALRNVIERRPVLVAARAGVERAIALARIPAEVTVTVDVEPGSVRLELDDFVLAVRGLVENAAEAMDGRGAVVVTGRAAGGRMVIEVADSGPGIAAADRGRVIQAFYTTKPARRGLGLNIARRVARRYDGELALLDAEKGARVALSFPIADRAPVVDAPCEGT
jgi:signal transduction histidine kinase